MAKVLHPITSCFKKPEIMEKDANSTASKSMKTEDCEKSGGANNAQPGLIWKVSSGLYSIGSGAIGLSVGSIKWAASTTYNVGTGVVSATQNVVSKVGVPVLKRQKSKPKEE